MGKGEEKTLCSPCQEKDREIERLTELLQEKDDETKVLKSNLISVKSRTDSMTFSFKRFEGSDDDIHFYSGFQNASSYREFMTFVLCTRVTGAEIFMGTCLMEMRTAQKRLMSAQVTLTELCQRRTNSF